MLSRKIEVCFATKSFTPLIMSAEKNKKIRLVLLGGGHTNTQVIKHILKKDVPDNIELILVSDYNTSLYSGMCPGMKLPIKYWILK